MLDAYNIRNQHYCIDIPGNCDKHSKNDETRKERLWMHAGKDYNLRTLSRLSIMPLRRAP